jgi:hypothetical protein
VAICAFFTLVGLTARASAAKASLDITEADHLLRVAGQHYDCTVSLGQPQFLRVTVDSLGGGRFPGGELRPPPECPRPTAARRENGKVEYRAKGRESSAAARWTFAFAEGSIQLISQWSDDDPPEPVVLDFDLKQCHATVLGLVKSEGKVALPAVMHLPDQGSFRVTAKGRAGATLDFDARRAVGPFAKVSFPPATRESPRVEYVLEVAAIHPQLPGIADDPRFRGFRRNWLNILQVNPRLGVLANNSASDTCASCVAEYADVALYSPRLTESCHPLDLIRQLLDRYISGVPGYGFPGWREFDFPDRPPHQNPIFLDAYPNLLIGARNYVVGSGDRAWLEKNYPAIRGWTDALLATDRDGNGLFEYELSGNSGSWPAAIKYRPANWWDTVGFGHEDAYSNALAYRALRGMEEMAADLGKTDDAAWFRAAADKVRQVYVKTFLNPATGVLAGWKSADGQLHDYYFLFVNGIAIHYGLVPREQANAIMDRLLAKMKEVGYTRFDLGLPGNLIPIARKDYVHLDRRWGGGQREDNSDGFQIYENGGATGCFAYFTLAALYDLGRRDDADRILFAMLDAYEKGSFQGRGANGMSNDWKAWDGTPWGYEGFLVDNYYALLAVLVREGQLDKLPTKR